VTRSRRELGRAGEALAARHLEQRGYRILARNVRSGGVELDLIARRGKLLVFVEVKTRRARHQGPAVLAVDAAKRARLVRGAVAWLAEARWRTSRVRFDVMGVEPDPRGEWKVEHIEGAFDAGDVH
jgi:putative endonuclease